MGWLPRCVSVCIRRVRPDTDETDLQTGKSFAFNRHGLARGVHFFAEQAVRRGRMR